MLLSEGRLWAIHHGDAIPHMLEEMPPASVELLITSPPFPQLYAYHDSPADVGNSEDFRGDAKCHLSYFFRGVARVLKPGRVAMIHCMDIVRMKRANGRGLFDFHGMLVRLGERAGLIREYTWMVRKGPQSQAIRTRSRELQFAGLESDRAKSRGALPDHLIKFMARGDNAVPVDSKGDVSRNDWIGLAEPGWNDIRETETLNVKGTKGEGDVRHVCPLQTQVIERLVKLYSNPGEIVFDPFMGIGSTAFGALRLGRRAYGAELKDEYHTAAQKNCERAVALRRQDTRTLFDAQEAI